MVNELRPVIAGVAMLLVALVAHRHGVLFGPIALLPATARRCVL